MDVQRSLSDIYNKCDLAHDTRSQLGAQEALQRAHRVRNARVCKKLHKGVHLGLDPVFRYTYSRPAARSALRWLSVRDSLFSNSLLNH